MVYYLGSQELVLARANSSETSAVSSHSVKGSCVPVHIPPICSENLSQSLYQDDKAHSTGTLTARSRVTDNLDDWLVHASSHQECEAHLDFLLSLARDRGLLVNFAKFHLVPTQNIVWPDME